VPQAPQGPQALLLLRAHQTLPSHRCLLLLLAMLRVVQCWPPHSSLQELLLLLLVRVEQ
jgi:hypothetical protein